MYNSLVISNYFMFKYNFKNIEPEEINEFDMPN